MRTNPMSILTCHFPFRLQHLYPKQAFILLKTGSTSTFRWAKMRLLSRDKSFPVSSCFKVWHSSLIGTSKNSPNLLKHEMIELHIHRVDTMHLFTDDDRFLEKFSEKGNALEQLDVVVNWSTFPQNDSVVTQQDLNMAVDLIMVLR